MPKKNQRSSHNGFSYSTLLSVDERNDVIDWLGGLLTNIPDEQLAALNPPSFIKKLKGRPNVNQKDKAHTGGHLKNPDDKLDTNNDSTSNRKKKEQKMIWKKKNESFPTPTPLVTSSPALSSSASSSSQLLLPLSVPPITPSSFSSFSPSSSLSLPFFCSGTEFSDWSVTFPSELIQLLLLYDGRLSQLYSSLFIAIVIESGDDEIEAPEIYYSEESFIKAFEKLRSMKKQSKESLENFVKRVMINACDNHYWYLSCFIIRQKQPNHQNQRSRSRKKNDVNLDVDVTVILSSELDVDEDVDADDDEDIFLDDLMD